MKLVFVLAGSLMAAGGVWTLVRPLWKEGHPVMALLVGVLVVGLLLGLLYFLLG